MCIRDSATSSHSDLPRQLGSKGEIYEVSHSIDLSSKVDASAKKFDQLLHMNKVSNAPNMQDVYSICASPMLLLLIVRVLVSLIV